MNVNFRSIRFRLTFWYVLVLTSILIAFSTLVYLRLAHRLNRNLDDTIQSQAEWIAGLLDIAEGGMDLNEFQEDLTEHGFGSASGQYVQIQRGTGEILYQSLSLDHPLGSSSAVRQGVSRGRRTLETIADPSEGSLRLVTLPVEDEGEIIYLVEVGARLSDIRRVLHALLFQLASTALLALLVSVLGGWFLVGKTLRPVDAMTRAAREIGAENLGERLQVPAGKDELSRLATTLNGMIERLEGSFRQVRQFTADASHELRTPLTVMRGQTEVALRRERTVEEYRQVLASNLEEIEWMSQIVEELLMLSRAEEGNLPLQKELVALKALLHEGYGEFRSLADSGGVTLHLGDVDDLQIRGDETRLRQMLWNLIDNAIKYTLAGGEVWLSLEAEEGYARIEVRDTGIGIPNPELPHIFERFYRVDKARSRGLGGSGLGLSIVQWIVDTHEGRIEVQSQPGEGSCFSVWLSL